MKRRTFLQNVGLALPPLFVGPALENRTSNTFHEYYYSHPENLEDAVSREGEIIIRLQFYSDSRIEQQLKPDIKIEKGNISRMKPYFFEHDEDHYYGSVEAPFISAAMEDVDIIVLWLDKFSEDTMIVLTEKAGEFSFILKDIIRNKEANGQIGNFKLKANFLLDKEIGKLQPELIGIKNTSDNFHFIIMADPQGGDTSDPEENLCRMKIHNAFIEESVRLANNLSIKPAFCLMLGDIVDHQGEARHFAQMGRFFDKLDMPVLYAMGNHESRYQTSFEPGYELSGFNNYFAAQKKLNGTEFLLYSFDLGKWHFIVWPDPLRHMFWETHPHYFDWLERDLEKHKGRPTFFFQHIPIHPAGIDPLENYCETPYVKRMLVDILSRHGNVRNIFSGHVHIPVKASFKTLVSLKGMNCINLPAAGYRPRSFGEEEYGGGPSQGICIVDVKGGNLTCTYKTVTLEEYTYPDKMPEFEYEKYPLWFGHKWELPGEKHFVNGDFKEGLKGWGRRFIYVEDEHPSNLCEIRKMENEAVLYLKTEKRGYHVPGQDRLPQDLNMVFQAVEIDQGKDPFIGFKYRLDGQNTDLSGFNGLYIWVEGFRKSARIVNLLYFANKAFVNIGSTYSRKKGESPLFYLLDDTADRWHKVLLNVKADFESNTSGCRFDNPAPDRLVISCGIWNINDGRKQPLAAFLKDFTIQYGLTTLSQINDRQIEPVPDDKKWWQGKLMTFGNLAGEHHYHIENLSRLKY